MEEKGERAGNELASDITILNDPTNMVYESSTRNLTLYIQNTGSLTIDTSLVEVYINGTYRSTASATLLGGASSWQPSKSLQIIVTLYLPSGDHSLKIIAQNGVSDSLSFRI